MQFHINTHNFKVLLTVFVWVPQISNMTSWSPYRSKRGQTVQKGLSGSKHYFDRTGKALYLQLVEFLYWSTILFSKILRLNMHEAWWETPFTTSFKIINHLSFRILVFRVKSSESKLERWPISSAVPRRSRFAISIHVLNAFVIHKNKSLMPSFSLHSKNNYVNHPNIYKHTHTT